MKRYDTQLAIALLAHAARIKQSKLTQRLNSCPEELPPDQILRLIKWTMFRKCKRHVLSQAFRWCGGWGDIQNECYAAFLANRKRGYADSGSAVRVTQWTVSRLAEKWRRRNSRKRIPSVASTYHVDVDDFDARTIIERIGERLTNRQAVVIARRFEGATLDECGEGLGLSPERVRQIEQKSLRLMRHEYREYVREEMHKGHRWAVDAMTDLLREVASQE